MQSLTKYIEEKLGIILCVHVLYQFHVIKFKYSIQVHSFHVSNFLFFKIQLSGVFCSYFFSFTSNDEFSAANDFLNIHVMRNNIPRLDNIILFRNLFLSYTNINYSSFFCHLRNFNCQRMLFNWLDVGTSISQFNLFKHEIFIYSVFGECVTVKNSDNDLELYLKLIECNFRPSSYFLFA